ncbi:MAG: TSUP family transporter [Candidatus Dormibacteria bacterium]
MELVLGLLLGAAVGILSGALGVGGGGVMVPVMVLSLGIEQATAQGTSLLAILPTAASGAWEHLRHGTLDLRLSLLLGGAGALGAVIGSIAALRLEPRRLRQVFAAYLLLLGAQTLLAAVRMRPTKA